MIRVSRWALGFACSGFLLFGYGLGVSSRPAASIGDHNVPSGLHCQEDEVLGVPSTPHGNAVCIHNESGRLEP